jgi:hypothetical protein
MRFNHETPETHEMETTIMTRLGEMFRVFRITVHENFVFLRKLFSGGLCGVAQICNLLYRRIAFGGAPGAPKSSDPAAASGLQIRDTAKCNSAPLWLRLRRAKYFAV